MLKSKTWDATLAVLSLVFCVGFVVKSRSWLLSANLDISGWLMPWLDHILAVGPARSLEGSFSNYTPPYIYVLSLSSLLYPHVPKVLCIKLVNLPFVPLAGWAAWRILRILGADRLRAGLGVVILIFLPEVTVNAWHWGQCDIMFTAMLLWMTAFLLERRNYLAMAAFGVALAFKLQAIFVCPVLLALLLAGELTWASTLAMVPAYLLMMVPAWLAGRSWIDLLTIYARLADLFIDLTMGMPNIYVVVLLMTVRHVTVITHLGTLLGGVASALFLYLLFGHPSLRRGHGLVLALTASLLFLPYLLPKMHERYFFAGNCFLAILGVLRPKYFCAAALMQVAALMAYSFFMHGKNSKGWDLVPALCVASVGLAMVAWYVREASQTEADPVGSLRSLSQVEG